MEAAFPAREPPAAPQAHLAAFRSPSFPRGLVLFPQLAHPQVLPGCSPGGPSFPPPLQHLFLPRSQSLLYTSSLWPYLISSQ